MSFQEDAAAQLISSDLKELGLAANKLAEHAIKLGGLGFGATFFGLIAAIAAMCVPSLALFSNHISITLSFIICRLYI